MLTITCMHAAILLATAAEPNPPNWPESVHVFGPTSNNIEAVVQAAYAKNGGHQPANHGQFSEERYAFLFKPGKYNVDVPIGYYTQVLGLGATPGDTVFTSSKGVFSQEQDYSIGGALSTFWRSAENFRTEADYKWYVGTGMMWAVSQAAPLRRVEVVNDLLLFEYEPPISPAGESSGGYFANLKVGTNSSKAGHVKCGSQQQWFARDSTVAGWEGGVWNMVFTGVDGAPASHCGNTPPGPYTAVDKTPVIAEKPFIVFEGGKFSLKVPQPKTNSRGADHRDDSKTIPFEQVYVASPGDSASKINSKLSSGLHVVVSPGIYHLDQPLLLSHPGQVLLGLGLATLVPSKQNTLIKVGDVDGVRVAGFLLQAGPAAGDKMSPSLLEWGTGAHAGTSADPGVISDVFARVGGPDGTPAHPVAADTMILLRTGHVIIDNSWLWRADHAAGAKVTYTSNRCKHGLVVAPSAAHVTTYGLAVEHTEQDLTVWAGEGGQVFFYQSELPYVVTQQQFGDPGYTGFRVDANVTSFDAWGIGVYSFFNAHEVVVKSAIVAPPALEHRFHDSLTVFLNGHGRIEHILNQRGAPANKPGTAQYLC